MGGDGLRAGAIDDRDGMKLAQFGKAAFGGIVALEAGLP